ncbi:MAG: hypothetical protein P1U85_20330, partial [Verrucomicrobiales bacterium]|nr:hypothetical protein [Verrucomicrobiales bacterium]
MSHSDSLEQAEGFIELGMFSDAWQVIEDLPPEERTSEPVLVIRLRILTGLSQWELGEHIASVLLSGGAVGSGRTIRKAIPARFAISRARIADFILLHSNPVCCETQPCLVILLVIRSNLRKMF